MWLTALLSVPWEEEPTSHVRFCPQLLSHLPSAYVTYQVWAVSSSVKSESVSHLVVSDSLWPHGLEPARLLCPWNSPGKNTGVGCHFLLQGIYLTKGLNPSLLHCRWIFFTVWIGVGNSMDFPHLTFEVLFTGRVLYNIFYNTLSASLSETPSELGL